MDDTSEIAYCPTLDSRMGFTAPDGPLYDDGGSPIDGLVEVLGDVVDSQPTSPGQFTESLASLWENYLDSSGGGGGATQGSETQTQTLVGEFND